MSKRVLLAEDDRATRESIARALELDGYEVRAVPDGAAALEAFEEDTPDLLVLDLMMPNVDGLTVCRRLRARSDHTPILIATARTEVSDRVSGLDAGADDYLPKPFALDELLARVRALLRRTTYDTPDRELRVEDLRLDEAARRVWRGDQELDLTKTEFDLLQLLARNAGIVLVALDDLRAHLGLRLRLGVQVARRLHRLPAPQDRGGRRSPPDPDRSRGRVHAASVMTLRARFAVALGLLAGLSVVVVAVASYLATVHQLHTDLDNEVVSYASRFTDPGGRTARMLCQTS